MTKTTTPRTPKAGYREHDGVSDWQECDTCHLLTGAGFWTEYDEAYYSGDPAVCPRCAEAGRDGLMCLRIEE